MNDMNEEAKYSTEETAKETSTVEATPEAEETVTIVGIRFRSGSKTYYFDPGELILREGDPVVVETARGMEFATVSLANCTVNVSQIVSPLKRVIRAATPADIKKNEDNLAAEVRARHIFLEKIAKHGLEMKLVDVEYTFDNQKLLFYFTAEGRVDFRELVKDLASVFRTRIELRQIGIRDEAKMMGGLGICGRPFCCASFLTDFVQVSIKMAKEQNFSLNSAKISGSCGRLMCCLRYEHEVYEEALKTTPPVGSIVETTAGTGVVIEARPLAQVIKVRLDGTNDPPKLYPCAEVTVITAGKGKRPKPETKDETVEEGEESTDKRNAKHSRRGGKRPTHGDGKKSD